MSKNTLLETFPHFLTLDNFLDQNFYIMSTLFGLIGINYGVLIFCLTCQFINSILNQFLLLCPLA